LATATKYLILLSNMATEVEEIEPSEIILKLVFPYLPWNEIITSCELVCKKWNVTSTADAVWRSLCDNKINLEERRLCDRREWAREEWKDRVYVSSGHRILATQMSKRISTRRSLRDIYIMSHRVGETVIHHEIYGPDASRESHGPDARSLRDACAHDFRWIVGPGIERLRQVFRGREGNTYLKKYSEIAAMKSRLLSFAQSNTILRRQHPSCLEKDELLKIFGHNLLAASTMVSKSLDDSTFISTSPFEATLGEMINKIEDLVGGEISVSLAVQLQRSSEELERKFSYQPAIKKLRSSMNDLDWPISPVDNLCFLIEKLWVWEHDLEYPGYYHKLRTLDIRERERKKLWEIAIIQWWNELSKPLRKLLVTLYNEISFEEALRLKSNDPDQVPIEALKLIVESRYPYFRYKIAKYFWRDIDPDLCESLFKIYHEQSCHFCDTIRREYLPVYGDEIKPERSANLLLDIFLEVRPVSEHTDAPEMSSAYCYGLMDRMVEAMDRWDQLIGTIKEDENVLWDHQTIVDINTIALKFDINDYRLRRALDRNVVPILHNEFDVRSMETRYLNQVLSSDTMNDIPDFRSLKVKLKQIHKKMIDQKDLFGQMPQNELTNLMSEFQKTMEKFNMLGKYCHIREHAMIALVPLLSNLCAFDSKRLVYALFIQFRGGDRSRCLRRSSKDEMSDLYSQGIPCPRDSSDPIQKFSNDLSDSITWTKSTSWEHCSSHQVLSRLFGHVPLPENIVSAMCEFMLENLYQTNVPNDVDFIKSLNALGVLPYLERFCYENPDRASIVFDCLERAIRNSVRAVCDLDVDDIGQRERDTFKHVVNSLVSACVSSGAKLFPVLRSLYEGTQFELLQDNFVRVETLIQRINEAPKIFADTNQYYRNEIE